MYSNIFEELGNSISISYDLVEVDELGSIPESSTSWFSKILKSKQ